MEILILGLIVYVVISVIGEMAKRKPSPAPGHLRRIPMETAGPFPTGWPSSQNPDEEGSGLEGSLVDEDNAGPSEMDSPSLEGEGSLRSPFYESTEGESIEGSDAGGEAFDGSSIEIKPRVGKKPDWQSDDEEADPFLAEGEAGWGDESGLKVDASRKPILHSDDDILKGVILSEVLKRPRRFPGPKPHRRA